MSKLTILSFLLFLSFQSFSQNDWELINNYDLKFKLPIGYSFNEVQNVKIYSYTDDNKIISISIFKTDESLNEMIEEDKLKKYYQGFINGYADNAGNKIILSSNYKIDNILVSKNLLEVNYPDGINNLLEAHILLINGFNYFLTFQTEEQPLQIALDDKKVFLIPLSSDYFLPNK